MRVITVGRSEDNDKVVMDPCTSRHHLQIIQHDDGHFTLFDFGSSNGTFVNGQKISGEIPLTDMDIVRIGNTTIPWRMYFDEEEQPREEVLPQPENRMQTVIPEKKSRNGNVECKERNEVALSTMTPSVSLMVAMSIPLLILMLMGAWIVVARLVIALLFGVLAIVYVKKADKKVLEDNIEKAVKAAKNAKGFNIVQIIYGIFSWIALIRVLLQI